MKRKFTEMWSDEDDVTESEEEYHPGEDEYSDGDDTAEENEDDTMYGGLRLLDVSPLEDHSVLVTFVDGYGNQRKAVVHPSDLDWKWEDPAMFASLLACTFDGFKRGVQASFYHYLLLGVEYEDPDVRLVFRKNHGERRRFYVLASLVP